MNRETGWYWVKRNSPHSWLNALWQPVLWAPFANGKSYWVVHDMPVDDANWDQINETRILNPDER